MTELYSHNVLEKCEVFELGENGGAWFVAHTGQREIAEAAVIRWLTKALGDDHELIGAEVHALVEAQAQIASGWWFDPRDDTLKRAMGTPRYVQSYSGVAFGVAWVDERPIPREVYEVPESGDLS